MLLFELVFRDARKLATLIKTCEGMGNQSDTALFKVKPRGVYIMLTDVESICCLEVRMTEPAKNALKLYCKEFTAKITLDSLVNLVRKLTKEKHVVSMFADDQDPYTLQVSGLHSQTMKTIETHRVEGTEHRARVYHVISTTQFKERSGSYAQFRIQNVELNKIITMQCIMSGNSGGVGEVRVVPNEGGCSIGFFVRNNSGAAGGVTIHTHATAASVPLQHRPDSSFTMRYFLAYLKRSQNLFANPADHVTIYVSERGMLVQTDMKDNQTVVVFISDISGEDIDSYA